MGNHTVQKRLSNYWKKHISGMEYKKPLGCLANIFHNPPNSFLNPGKVFQKRDYSKFLP